MGPETPPTDGTHSDYEYRFRKATPEGVTTLRFHPLPGSFRGPAAKGPARLSSEAVQIIPDSLSLMPSLPSLPRAPMTTSLACGVRAHALRIGPSDGPPPPRQGFA